MNKGALKLSEYMDGKGLSQGEVAKMFGVTQGFISDVLACKKTPGGMLAHKINKLIRGIKIGDWWEEV